MAVLAALFISGIYLDGWAHTHGHQDGTFFSRWHTVLYSGHALVSLALLGKLWQGWRSSPAGKSLSLIERVTVSLPAGYGASLLGAAVFAAGGVGDLLWHAFMGKETGLEAVISPSHFALAAGVFLMAGGPFRAARLRDTNPTASWRHVPMLLSLTGALSVITGLFLFFHFIPNPNLWSGGGDPAARAARTYLEFGSVVLLFSAGVQINLVLYAIRYWNLPFGALALVYGLNGFGMGFLNPRADPALGYAIGIGLVMAAAGLASDLLILRFKPAMDNPRGLRWFAFLSPISTYLIYFGLLSLRTNVWWSFEMWSGISLLSGALGLLSSYQLLPPDTHA